MKMTKNWMAAMLAMLVLVLGIGFGNGLRSEVMAKDVSKDLLSVKFQIATQPEEDGCTYVIRFVSSVDSLDYQQVGFVGRLKGELKNLKLENSYHSGLPSNW